LAQYAGAYAEAEATFIAVGPDVRDQIVDRNPRRFFGLAPFWRRMRVRPSSEAAGFSDGEHACADSSRLALSWPERSDEY
jgi:hypothetical protein